MLSEEIKIFSPKDWFILSGIMLLDLNVSTTDYLCDEGLGERRWLWLNFMRWMTAFLATSLIEMVQSSIYQLRIPALIRIANPIKWIPNWFATVESHTWGFRHIASTWGACYAPWKSLILKWVNMHILSYRHFDSYSNQISIFGFTIKHGWLKRFLPKTDHIQL